MESCRNIRGRVARRPGLLAGATVALDQLTKLVAPLLAEGHNRGAVVPIHNHRFTLGIAGASVPITALLCIAVLVGFGAYTVHAVRHCGLPAWVPALLISGALSNLFDRVVLGSVRDFLATPWFVFNLADVAIVAGLCGYTLHQFRGKSVTSDTTSPAPEDLIRQGLIPRGR